MNDIRLILSRTASKCRIPVFRRPMMRPNSHNPLWLPQELWYRIIENFDNDLCTLSNCSLTCRAWAAAFRPLLFRRLRVTDRNLRRVHSLLLANKQIGTHVRHLTFMDFQSWSGQWQQEQRKTLAFILSQFPQVTNLTLGVLVLTPSMLDTLAPLSPPVQFLTVGTLVGTTPDAFTRFIRAFSNLHMLSVEEDLYIHPEGKGLSSASVMERLMRTLGIAFTPPAQREPDWYQQAISSLFWNLSHRTIRGDPRALAALLQDAAPSLTCLRLDFRCLYDDTVVFGKMDNTSITCLEFWGVSPYDKYWIPQFLSQVRTASIREVKFRDFPSGSSTRTTDLLRALEPVLSRAALPALQKVTFSVGVSSSATEHSLGCTSIQALLPHLDAEGLLEFED
ncbi:predicted protein [Postia placenta Mad-698-R]|uniref:F-box domain-containing protein n=1 Tax=Postia placenta MAD-698-R-SB12 TaxID=670580 RepID=A0A1X6MJK1_9APHY|nr:hypothetical protein POSPLADRAFT_1159779 [Postia placenta MAD-698-R-SB12]EED79935.1 predicted protein [Postia placenta Mad-698-R]OSX56550.1 hypothetical protein POSPLADRAFT_1159779 [Postia placenta MAD-698-R-SB12]